MYVCMYIMLCQMIFRKKQIYNKKQNAGETVGGQPKLFS